MLSLQKLILEFWKLPYIYLPIYAILIKIWIVGNLPGNIYLIATGMHLLLHISLRIENIKEALNTSFKIFFCHSQSNLSEDFFLFSIVYCFQYWQTFSQYSHQTKPFKENPILKVFPSKHKDCIPLFDMCATHCIWQICKPEMEKRKNIVQTQILDQKMAKIRDTS